MDAADYFRGQAAECRRLAAGLPPSRDRSGLNLLAQHYEREARRAAADDPPRQAPRPSGPFNPA
ncbi:MAG TPA: hypothetical protein VF727_12770 [Allosphingosinicella sp.]|jgi:hypothetical protein